MDSDDAVSAFIKSKQKFSLSHLVGAHCRMCVLQLKNGCVTYDDALQSIRSQLGRQFNVAELNAHAGLMVESVVSPSISASGQIKLQVNKDVIGDDDTFISCLLAVLQRRCAGAEYAQVEEFRREAISYLRRLGEVRSSSTEPSTLTSVESNSDGALFETAQALRPVRVPAVSPIPTVTAASALAVAHATQPFAAPTPQTVTADHDATEDQRFPPSRKEIERAEPIVRLLAQVRKVGMDILLPQSTHDKVSTRRRHLRCKSVT
jgi:hypothetical protein